MDAERFDVAVVGGGLAGLAAAATAAGHRRRVVLLDGHPFGGRARTDERGGFTFNRGPRALYLDGVGVKVLRGFGIEATGGRPPLSGARGVIGGRLGRLPGTPWELARSDVLRPRSKAALARFMVTSGRLHPDRYAGVDVDTWLATTGLPDDAVALAHMLVRVATYVNDPGHLSAEVAVGQLQMALGKGVLYLDGGFQQLVDALASVTRRRGVELRSGVSVRSLSGELGRFGVELSDGSVLEAATVVVACGSPTAAAALTHPGDTPPASWNSLGPPAAAACLELGLSRPASVTTAFGIDQPVYLNHHAPPASGLAPEGKALVHVMRYQEPGHERGADRDRQELAGIARLVGIADDLIEQERFLSRMVVTGGYPLASTGGLSARPPVLVQDRPGLSVAGDWVGPRGFLADAALASGSDAGRRAAEAVPERSRSAA